LGGEGGGIKHQTGYYWCPVFVVKIINFPKTQFSLDKRIKDKVYSPKAIEETVD